MRLTEQQEHIIQDYFKDKPVLKAYVFGSYARGDANEESDIDLLIKIDYKALQGGFWYFGISDALQSMLNVQVDIVTEQALSPYIQKYVERDKKLIYERTAA